MRTFTAAADSVSVNSCSTCCCVGVPARKTEQGVVQIRYAPWIMPQGNGARLIDRNDFIIEKTVSNDPVVPSGGAMLVAANAQQLLLVDTPDTIDLSTLISGASGPVTISIVSLAGPEHGVATIAGTDLTYTPASGYKGLDRLYYRVQEDDSNRYVVGQITYRIGQPIATQVAPLLEPVYVSDPIVDSNRHEMSFMLHVTEQARLGEVYRLTIRQYSYDCNGRTTYHESCYDIAIGKC
jgi:hypothetical protein